MSAFSPDAPDDVARAREQRLQGYRDRRLERQPFVLEDVAWIAGLASAGHVPAAALLRKLEGDGVLKALHDAAPDAFEDAALEVPFLASWMAVCAGAAAQPDVDALRTWLGLADPRLRAFAAVFEAIEAAGDRPGPSDAARIGSEIVQAWAAPEPRSTGPLLLAFAEARLLAKRRAPGLALLQSAAAAGSRTAAAWTWLHEAAGRSEALRRIVDAVPVPSQAKPEQLMWQALDLETGAAGEPDFESAVRLYEMGTKEPAHAGDGSGPLSIEFVLAVGRWLTWRPDASDRRAREAGLGWFERALARGEPRGLAGWLLHAADPTSVVARGPDEAMAQVERFLALGTASIERHVFGHGLTIIVMHAKDLLRRNAPEDAALAAQWLRVPVTFEEREACYLLGVLLFNGTGVAKDRAEARRLIASAAAAWHAPAVEALKKIDSGVA